MEIFFELHLEQTALIEVVSHLVVGKIKAVTVFSWVEEEEICVWHMVLTTINKLIHKIFFYIDPREIFFT